VLMLDKDGGINKMSVPKVTESDGMKRSIKLPQRKENVKEQTEEKSAKPDWYEKSQKTINR